MTTLSTEYFAKLRTRIATGDSSALQAEDLNKQVDKLESALRIFKQTETQLLRSGEAIRAETMHQSLATSAISSHTVLKYATEYADNAGHLEAITRSMIARVESIQAMCRVAGILCIAHDFTARSFTRCPVETARKMPEDFAQYALSGEDADGGFTLVRTGPPTDWTDYAELRVVGKSVKTNQKVAKKMEKALNYASAFGFNDQD